MLTCSPSWGDLSLLTWREVDPGSSVADSVRRAYRRIAARLRQDGEVVLQERLYGSVAASSAILAARAEALAEDGVRAVVPPTFVEGASPAGLPWVGCHIVSARPRTPSDHASVGHSGDICGRTVIGREASYLGLSDAARIVRSRDCSRQELVGRTLSAAAAVLEGSGWGYADVVRTWFYLDDILAWYDDFNRARSEFLRDEPGLDETGIGNLPASTGVSGRSRWGAACTLDLLAVRPDGGSACRVERLRSPIQSEASDYGSAFSRGQVIWAADGAYVLASGTAAIDGRGRTLHVGDFIRQAETTFDTVGGLLAGAGARLDHIVQGTAFVARPEDAAKLDRILERRELEEIPLVTMVADICREDLLFELDATAAVAGRGGHAL